MKTKFEMDNAASKNPRPNKKVLLNKTTIRRLAEEDLSNVGGGGTVTCAFSCSVNNSYQGNFNAVFLKIG